MWTIVALAIGVAAPADVAQQTAVAVLLPTTQGDVDAAIPAAVMALAAGALQEGGALRVVTHDDIQQMVNYDQMKVALTCEESASCLAEIGSALGVPYLMATSCSRLGSAYVLSLSLVGIDPPLAIGRKTLTISSEDELLTAVPTAVSGLKALIAPPSSTPPPPPTTTTTTTTTEATTTTKPPPTEATPPPSKTTEAPKATKATAPPEAEAPETSTPVGAIALSVVGGVLVVASGVAVVLGGPVYFNPNANRDDRLVAGVSAGAGVVVGLAAVIATISGVVMVVSE